MEPYPMHIAFCVNDKYASYICVTIKSILENNPGRSITVHVLTDWLSEKRRKRLREVIRDDASVRLEIHIVDDTPLRGLKQGRWTIYAWYRVLLPQILSQDIHRVLYLDADTLVTDTLDELFGLNMTGKAIAAVIDSASFDSEPYIRCGYEPDKKYICSGVMLMNLDYWREHNLADKIIAWGGENSGRIELPDQDAINYICRDSKIILPLRYGITCYCLIHEIFFSSPFVQELLECIEKPAIIHYAVWGPWIKELSFHPMQVEWEKYNKMLRHPVRRTYKAKGWLLVKIIVWNILHYHSFNRPASLTLDDVKRKLSVNQ